MIFGDTIAAIATPPGVGGLGVIRISGPDAERIALAIFTPLPSSPFVSHHLYHGKITSPVTHEPLDEVLIALFRAPHSFTGEDTLEISCHGGPRILGAVLDAVLHVSARPAQPGEFTRRAFLNNRMDLARAEAVNDVITAATSQGATAALGRLTGRLSGKIEKISEEMLTILARIEASIDFTEEDGMEEETGDLAAAVNPLIAEVERLANTYRHGKIFRKGVGIVIAGRPNVGKSSLLNRLLGEKRAIVSSTPGTTRDFIEETADIAGIPVRLTDTAGLRQPQDDIEKAGIDFLWEKVASADAVLFLLDASREIADDELEIIKKVSEKPLLLVLNKSDLPARTDEKSLEDIVPLDFPPVVKISAKYGDGMENLFAAIGKLALQTETGETPAVMIAHAHQKASLEKANKCLKRAAAGAQNGMTPEIVALELREALDFIGEITGKTTSEDILTHIFSRFCIGK
jgi:tRNA modification GTPase